MEPVRSEELWQNDGVDLSEPRRRTKRKERLAEPFQLYWNSPVLQVLQLPISLIRSCLRGVASFTLCDEKHNQHREQNCAKVLNPPLFLCVHCWKASLPCKLLKRSWSTFQSSCLKFVLFFIHFYLILIFNHFHNNAVLVFKPINSELWLIYVENLEESSVVLT